MCAPCKHKQAMAAKRAMQNSPTFQKIQAKTVQNVGFVELYYVGPENTTVPSIISNVSYGFKSYGEKMFVATLDYNEHPELWAENEPTNNINSN